MQSKLSFAFPVASLVVLPALLAGCGGSPRQATIPQEPMSAEQHDREARKHETIAEDYAQRADANQAEFQRDPSAQCFDDPLEGVSGSGGEPFRPLRPCWSALNTPSAQYRQQAKRHRTIAAKHRAMAAELRSAERNACAGLGENEIALSPFAQRADIVSVQPIGAPRSPDGAQIVFRKVPGLTASWMERALGCHHARAAVLGFPTDFMAFSPLTLPDTRYAIEETPDSVVVTVTSERSEMAAAALGRANDLQRMASR